MKKLVLGACAIAALASCQKGDNFTIEGKIKDGVGKTIYLESVGLNNISIIDSVVIKKSGDFKFKRASSTYKPEYYQLRLNNQFIALAIDSTETVKIEADTISLSSNYRIEGSETNDKIKRLNISAARLRKEIEQHIKDRKDNKLSEIAFRSEMDSSLSRHKDLAIKIIFEDIRSSSAYYALYQNVNGYLIFDPNSKADFKIYAAVANSYNLFNPESPRTKQLYSFVEQVLKNNRIANNSINQELYADIADDMDHFNIELPNNMGAVKSLADLKGSVVLLSFTTYHSEYSPVLNMQLNDLYNKYKNQGFEIFQVSFDMDEHFWKVSASNIPWIAVRDARSSYSPYVSLYNIEQLPSMFVLNRKGEIVNRVEKSTDLENIVKKYL
ncbi:MAG: thioredoxin-like domain-containing protein [Bacteroidales bacterium]